MKMAVVPVLARRTGHLAQRLAHEAGLQTDVAVTHLALDLGAGHERRDGVDDDDVERAGAHQHVGDLERLLPGVGLRHEQGVGVDAELLGVVGVEGVLGVDERRDAAGGLGVGDRVQGHRRLAGALRAVDLHDAAARQAADAERDVERDRPGGDHADRDAHLVAEAHDRALAEALVDLREGHLEGLRAVWSCHVCSCGRRAPDRGSRGGCPIGGDARSEVRQSPGLPAALWTPGRGRR
jgi:hypothetical protein